MRIIGIVGNPRKGGNTEILTRIALEEIQREGIETELITLADKEIKPCDACLSCRRTGECHIKDDLAPILKKFLEADGIILATPIYFGSATPQMKALIDRVGYWSRNRGMPFENKVGGPIVVARRAGHNFTYVRF